MRANKLSVVSTIVVFSLSLLCAAYGELLAQDTESNEITRMLKEAEEAYQNGNFTLAIEKYQKLIELFNSKKELAKVKQDLLQTIGNLALTYFTIRENEKAEKQLVDLLRINPNQVLDSEVFPPKFLELFQKVQRSSLGKLSVSSMPVGADVILNGDPVGQSPQTLEKLFKGSYELKVAMDGYKPVTKQIEIVPEAAVVEAITLEKIEKPAAPVVEKKAEKPPAEAKKKKGFPILPVILGGVAVVVILLLLMKKEETVLPVEKSFTIENAEQMDIQPANVTPFTRKFMHAPQSKVITRVHFAITIEHPAWEELNVALNKQGNGTIFVAWNRSPKSGRATIEGDTTSFSGLDSLGDWIISVENFKLNSGLLLKCTLQFFYME